MASASSRTWKTLTPPLAEWIIDAVDSMGFKRMTPVQASTIPLFMTYKDVVVEDLQHFLQHSPNLLISTPGRLLELLSSPHVHCPQSSFEVLVLDEADRLLDLGFKEDLQKILARLPKQRRTGLFSASVSEAVDQIIRVGLRNPVKIAVKVKSVNNAEDRRTPASLSMKYVICPASQKLPNLSRILQSLDTIPSKTIVYLSTCAAVDYFQHVLPVILPSHDDQPFTLVPLHGKHPPKIRQKNFAAFSNSTMPSILLTTDVAARGLDIPQVDLVIQVDPPSDPKVFLHRCGRAGRAGRRGLSVIFLQPGREEDYIPFLEVRKTPVTPLDLPPLQQQGSGDDVTQASTAIREKVLTDRALHDKAQRAFVSWVKAYSKHQASSIFRTSDLDWEDLGHAWGLLRLPSMPELKKWEGDRSLGLSIDFDGYGYRDKKREQVRREQLHEQQQQQQRDGAREAGGNTDRKKAAKRAWSQKLNEKDERERRREKKRMKREAEKWEKMTPAEREKQLELERMIEAVKRQKMEEDQLEEFHGFND
ncbi:MAG: hypothetical protein Q9201_007649 [Fulgogasparrea decipioides]